MKTKLISILIISISLNATTFSGIGYNTDQKEAKKEALSDLSNSISTNVQSKLKTITSKIAGDYQKNVIKVIELKSSLPIKSAKFTPQENSIIATISTKDSLKGYLTQLNILQKDIKDAYKSLNKTKNNNTKYHLATKLLKNIDDFNAHKIVASMLQSKNSSSKLPKLNVNRSKIEKIIYKLEEKADSLKLASKILTKNINQDNIYIVPLKTNGSSEVTQFAKVFKRHLERKVDATDTPKESDYILRGSYEVLKNKEMFISVKLQDNNNKIVNSSNIILSKKAYSKYKYKPKTKTIDEAINSSNVLNGDLRVQIAFKGYNRADGIDLSSGDIINIYGKTNKDICYFLQGITVTPHHTYSYILPRENGTLKSYIQGNDVNKEIALLSDVEVASPYGVEKLMMFAQTLQNGKCNIKVPKCDDDAKTGLCILNGKPSSTIAKTRALFSQSSKKNKTKRKIENAEASIGFTTFK